MAKKSGEPLHQMMSGWASHGTWMAPTERLEKMLEQDYGLSRSRSGTLTVTYPKGDKEQLASVDVLQKPGAASTDPGVVVVQAHPGSLNDDIFGEERKDYASARSFHDLYFVDDLSKVRGLQGDSVGNVEQCRDRMVALIDSLHEAAPVSTHDSYQGFERGFESSSATIGKSKFQAREDNTGYPFAVSAGYYQGVHNVLGLEADQKLAPKKRGLVETMKAGLAGAACAGLPALVGAVASGVSSLGLSDALMVSGVLTGGLTAAALVGTHIIGIEDYDSSIPGSYALAEKRYGQAKWMAAAGGAGLGLAMGLGCSAGISGVIGAAALGFGAGLAALK